MELFNDVMDTMDNHNTMERVKDLEKFSPKNLQQNYNNRHVDGDSRDDILSIDTMNSHNTMGREKNVEMFSPKNLHQNYNNRHADDGSRDDISIDTMNDHNKMKRGKNLEMFSQKNLHQNYNNRKADDDSKDDISLYDSFELEPLPTTPSRLNQKREVRPLFDLIFGILDTVHAASKQSVQRAREKNIQRIL